jgi:putative flippase GtrA
MVSVRSTASSSTTSSAERRGRARRFGRALGRYFVVGGIAAVIDIGLFLLFAQHLGMPYLRVAAASFVVATLANYWLSIRFVFVSGQRFRRRWEVALVFAVSLAGLALNGAILWLCVEAWHFGLIFAKLTATGVVFFWNFLARRVLVFGALK